METKRFGRRKFIALSGAGAIGLQAAAMPKVRRVLVMFKCHFDLGFIDTQTAVTKLYFERHFPQAITIAEAMHGGATPYTWTTGSWLLYEYLEQASRAERERMEHAISAGDIAWHALPFSWQTELLDRSSIGAMLGLSKALDQRFGKRTIGAKMTDVPGHSRGLIGPLAEGGVKFLDIGVNAASTAPEVPPLFNWQDGNGGSLVMMYHRKEYGGVVVVPGSDLAIDVEVKNDNEGPHTAEEIAAIYARLRKQFPGASVEASNLSGIGEAVVPFQKHFPVVKEEIGDTWIYGVGSDPVKLARYRELQRLRREWIGKGKLQVGDEQDLRFCRKFCLAAEHTWGTDTKTWLDFDTYRPADLAAKRNDPHYRTVENSWVEKRENLNAAVATLPEALQSEAKRRLEALQPTFPEARQAEERSAVRSVESSHFKATLDDTGALIELTQKSTGREWASREHPLAQVSYQTLSKADYDRFLDAYITAKTDWAPKDFGKPGIEKQGATSRTYQTKLHSVQMRREGERAVLEAQLRFEGEEGMGWPERLCLRVTLPDAEPVVELDLFWAGKPATRMPEALWFTFQPDLREHTDLILDKVEQPVNALSVVAGGNRHMHALTRGLTYASKKERLAIDSMDAPLIALGERSPIAFSRSQPAIEQGVHFSLFNNAWGTNYVQWFGEDMRYRFSLRAS